MKAKHVSYLLLVICFLWFASPSYSGSELNQASACSVCAEHEHHQHDQDHSHHSIEACTHENCGHDHSHSQEKCTHESCGHDHHHHSSESSASAAPKVHKCSVCGGDHSDSSHNKELERAKYETLDFKFVMLKNRAAVMFGLALLLIGVSFRRRKK